MLKPKTTRLFTIEELKAELRKPSPKVLDVRKEMAGVEIKANEDGSLDFVLSTATADRSNDTIDQAGWELDNYRKNPVVLWAHDYGAPPVAKPGLVGVESGKLMARGTKFCERDLYEFGWMVGEMYRRGYLAAVSIGMRPLEYAFNKERGDWAMDFKRQELLEFSCVPVPANPEALVSAKAAGIPLRSMVEWAERVIDETAKGDDSARTKLIVPREYVERLWNIARPQKVFSLPALEADVEETTDGDDDLVKAIEGLGQALTSHAAELAKNTAETASLRGDLARLKGIAPAPAPVASVKPPAAAKQSLDERIAQRAQQKVSALMGRVD